MVIDHLHDRLTVRTRIVAGVLDLPAHDLTASARVPTPAYSYGVASGFERHLERLVVFDRADGLTVSRDLEPAPSELDPEATFAGHPERC
jgi:hypothetical protein